MKHGGVLMDIVKKYNFNICWFYYIQKFHALFRKKLLRGKYAEDCGLSLRQIWTFAIDFYLWATLKDEFFKNNLFNGKALKKVLRRKCLSFHRENTEVQRTMWSPHSSGIWWRITGRLVPEVSRQNLQSSTVLF